MRALILTDIHANLVALETVLNHAEGYDVVWCLGDVIGYGPNPNECVELIQQQPELICLLGNHDAAALGILNLDTFNPEARLSIEWTRSILTDDTLKFLRVRPETAEFENVFLAHGSPRYPVFEYLLDTRSATENFDYFKTDFCFVGHTHLPVVFYTENENGYAQLVVPEPNTVTELKPRAIINPGSVGQPRDRDPRAAYAIFDTEKRTWTYNRVEYDIVETQNRMKVNMLPERHIERLAGGW